MHLDEPTYAALLAGTLPPARARALSAHLAGSCERCERFLAERPVADALDGRADSAIGRALPPAPAPTSDLGFARVLRGLREAPPRRRGLRALGALAATLAIVAAGGLVARQLRSSAGGAPWDGVKGGAAAAPAVRLRFARLEPRGEPVRGASGETLGREAVLLFEVESSRVANVALLRLAPDQAVEPIWSQRVERGRSVLGAGNRPAAYPLAALGGRQRFVLIAGEGEIDPRTAEQAVRSLAVGRGPDGPVPLSYDLIEVNVR